MYDNAESMVRVDCEWNNMYSGNIGIHQGLVFRLLLIFVNLEALSWELQTGCPRQLLLADDLIIDAESLKEVKNRLSIWKLKFAEKDLKVNVLKTTFLIRGRSWTPSKNQVNSHVAYVWEVLEYTQHTAQVASIGSISTALSWWPSCIQWKFRMCQMSRACSCYW